MFRDGLYLLHCRQEDDAEMGSRWSRVEAWDGVRLGKSNYGRPLTERRLKDAETQLSRALCLGKGYSFAASGRFELCVVGQQQHLRDMALESLGGSQMPQIGASEGPAA